MRGARTPAARSSAPRARFSLPVSGAAATLRHPTGAEDLLLAEFRADDPVLALTLAERLGTIEPGMEWIELPMPDIDTLIVRLRQGIAGNRVIADVTCAKTECAQRIDLSFSLDAYLGHHRPRPGAVRGRDWRVERIPEAGFWYVLQARNTEDVRFRLPALRDVLAVDGQADPVAALAARCIRPGSLPARARARVEAAMALLAPPLAGPLQGRCPDCGTPIAARFEARSYCLQELRDRARFVYDDIDVLAERYHWTERAILRLPHARRASYAERARQAQAG
jgi:hypothetical protein